MIFLTLLHFTMTYRFLYRHSKLLPAVINTGALFLIVMRQKRDLHGRYRIENKKTLVVQLWPCLLLTTVTTSYIYKYNYSYYISTHKIARNVVLFDLMSVARLLEHFFLKKKFGHRR